MRAARIVARWLDGLMSAWLLWLLLAGGLGLAELLTLDLILLMFAGGAVVTFGAAALGAPVPIQFAVFAVVSAGLLLLVRPVARRHLEASKTDNRDGVLAFVGRMATVTQVVDDHGGRVRINGDEWTAVTRTPLERHEVGETVRVMAIEGATAVVSGDMV